MPEILLPCAILKLNELKILTALLHNVFMHHYEKNKRIMIHNVWSLKLSCQFRQKHKMNVS